MPHLLMWRVSTAWLSGFCLGGSSTLFSPWATRVSVLVIRRAGTFVGPLPTSFPLGGPVGRATFCVVMLGYSQLSLPLVLMRPLLAALLCHGLAGLATPCCTSLLWCLSCWWGVVLLLVSGAGFRLGRCLLRSALWLLGVHTLPWRLLLTRRGMVRSSPG